MSRQVVQVKRLKLDIRLISIYGYSVHVVVYVGEKTQKMLVKNIILIRRQGGKFFFRGQEIPAVHEGDGWGVALLLVPSQVDLDFKLDGEYILFLKEDDRVKIEEMFDRSDDLTYEMLGRGWRGRRPYKGRRKQEGRLEEYM